MAVTVVRDLVAAGHDVELHLIGTGPLADAVAAAAADLPVVLRGRLDGDAVRRELLAADVLLHPAAFDGWGMAVVEAATSGCAVVATAGTDAAVELATVTPRVRVADPDDLPAAVAEVLRMRAHEPDDAPTAAARAVAGALAPRTLAARAREDLLGLVPGGGSTR